MVKINSGTFDFYLAIKITFLSSPEDILSLFLEREAGGERNIEQLRVT